MSDEQEAYVKAMEDATNSLNFVSDIELNLQVELGRAEVQIERVLGLKKGHVIEVNKLSGEPLDVRSNGRLVARGEAVIVNEKFGIRVTQIVSPEGDEEIL
ncbi:MAG: flagellar motor switch protein FliN [Bdellovibrionota bacterium]